MDSKDLRSAHRPDLICGGSTKQDTVQAVCERCAEFLTCLKSTQQLSRKGTMLSFIWPALFHLGIRGEKMVNRDRRFDQMIVALGCSICITGIYFSFIELLRAIKANDQ